MIGFDTQIDRFCLFFETTGGQVFIFFFDCFPNRKMRSWLGGVNDRNISALENGKRKKFLPLHPKE